jgi:hypothetical protein
MNKRLQELLERVAEWPPGAQEEAALTLEGIEASVIANSGLSTEEREAKLAALREMINNSISRGGSYTDEEVEASISTALDARERGRKSA